MKREGHLYEKIISRENLLLADQRARKGKQQYGIALHDRNRQGNIEALHRMLQEKTYRTSSYTTFKIYEPKEREIFRLPYYPDRIVHHAVMNHLEPIFAKLFTADTYSCIKGRGIHGAVRAVKRTLWDQAGTKYCLKLDIRKFYPSVDHQVLKAQLRRKFKDEDLLDLLGEIIDSAAGLPIGNYLSQYFANYYLTGFDHWIKEVKGIKYYFRYADDLVILASDKASLHALLVDIHQFVSEQLHLEIKKNYQVFPVAARGIDFVGYRFYHNHTLLRKTIKQRFARMLAKRPNLASIASYWGWAAHCNSRHLLKKLINEKIRRNGDQGHYPRFLRRQHQNRAAAEPGDNSASFRCQGIDQKSGNAMFIPPAGDRWPKASAFYRRPGAYRSHTEGSSRRLPFPDENQKAK